MAIAPISFPQFPINSSFDFTPLARLGQINQKDDTLAALAQRLGAVPDASGNSIAPASSASAASPVATRAPFDNATDLMANKYGAAISNIESGGKYDKLGPVTDRGDRAYGKYQVMGRNIPEWTQAALGTAMTPQQFLQSPAAQDAVFQHRFGSYVQKYGPGGAARAWFAGPGGMNNPNARDQLGTSVADYERRFLAGQ